MFDMENHRKEKNTSLFQVFLRLRPPPTLSHSVTSPERILTVEEPSSEGTSTSVVLTPPNDNRRKAVEKFTFTQIFKEDANQLDIFHGTNTLSLIERALGKNEEGKDGLLATLGVTGSGKTYTMFGSRSQRGLIQLILDVLFRSISKNMYLDTVDKSLHASVAAADSSEAQIISAQNFLETIYPDLTNASRAGSRAQTPISRESNFSTTPRRILPQSSMPCTPDISHVTAQCDPNAQYAILISMYEVYNDRIFDLLAPALPTKSTKEYRRRPLLYKHTENSPHKKVVAGIRKIICVTNKEALMVLDAGLHERQVAVTGSNSVSSRSHGFISIEIKKRKSNWVHGQWISSSLTIVDLAGSERARDAKTQGATLVEAGKINESLMYLGQCLQIQSDMASSTKQNFAPFRQCKLTELLFANCFAHTNNGNPTPLFHHNPQKAIMIVMADPIGDFNATSQILRYSSLAREVTVPRIPSVTSTTLSHSSTDSHTLNTTRTLSSRLNPNESERATMEIAALEIARMSDEIECLRVELEGESMRRAEVEAHAEWLSNCLVEVEADIREECFRDMEERIETEMRRWKATWELEANLKDEHLDRKLEIYTQSIAAISVKDEEDKENTHNGTREDLEAENLRLKIEVEKLKREIQGRSPSKIKRLPLQEKGSLMSDSRPRDSASSNILKSKYLSPTKKPSKSTSQKWKSLQDDPF